MRLAKARKIRRDRPEEEPESGMSAHWREKAELAASTLDFFNRLYSAVQVAFLRMLNTGADLTFQTLTTQNNRPCVVIVAVGDDACQRVVKFHNHLLTDDNEDQEAE